MGISVDCLFQEVKCFAECCLRARRMRERTQIQIVCSQIARLAFGRAADFNSSQCGFDDSSNASCDLILEIENVFQRAVETIRPAVLCDQRSAAARCSRNACAVPASSSPISRP